MGSNIHHSSATYSYSFLTFFKSNTSYDVHAIYISSRSICYSTIYILFHYLKAYSFLISVTFKSPYNKHTTSTRIQIICGQKTKMGPVPLRHVQDLLGRPCAPGNDLCCNCRSLQCCFH